MVPAYASPILYGGGDSPQLVTQTQNHLVSIDFKTGRLLWRQPFSTNYYQNSITPVISDDLLIYSGLDSGLLSLRLKNDAPPEPVWKNTQASLYMSSPVLVDGLLYGHSHKRKGQFFCLDPATGELVWSSRGREGEKRRRAGFLSLPAFSDHQFGVDCQRHRPGRLPTAGALFGGRYAHLGSSKLLSEVDSHQGSQPPDTLEPGALIAVSTTIPPTAPKRARRALGERDRIDPAGGARMSRHGGGRRSEMRPRLCR